MELVVEEGLLVGDDVGALKRGQYSNFVKGILLLFRGEVIQFYLLQRIDLVVAQSTYFIYSTKCTLTQL